MNPVPPQPSADRKTTVPPLHNGDRLTQKEFHRRYEASPPHLKAELIGGIVHVPSPLRRRHGAHHALLSMALGNYQVGTPGVEVLDNTTTILGEESEPQPDLLLWVLPEYGGQSRENEDEYVEGAPELVAEIAHSSRSIDLHRKRDDYQRCGVLEYVVVCVEEPELYWFHFPSGGTVKPTRQGVWRSRVFPGLWIDGRALLERKAPRLAEVVQQGLASRPHAAFVKRLEKAHRRRTPPR
jgi:Uma2 family endonuclease